MYSSYEVFKECILAILLWTMTTTATICIAVHIFDDSFSWHYVWPMSVLGAESLSYLYISIRLHILLVKVKEEEKNI